MGREEPDLSIVTTGSEGLFGTVPFHAQNPSLVSGESPLQESAFIRQNRIYRATWGLTFGDSVSISHTRQVASPEPVAAYRPVGECAQHKIGEA